MRLPDSLAAGLLHGPAELLPVSSSGHVAAARVLIGWSEPDEVALHAGSLAALVIARRAEAVDILRRLSVRRIGMHLLAGGIPAVVGFALERSGRGVGGGARGARRRSAERGAPSVIAGLLAGAALLAAGERGRGSRSRWDAGPVDGLWLGLAQTAALWPGVSRNGATLAAARLRGFAPAEANPLSREVGVPVTLGAVALRRGPLGMGSVAAFVSAWAALPLLRLVDSGGPLWPFAVERAGLALVLLRESRRV